MSGEDLSRKKLEPQVAALLPSGQVKRVPVMALYAQSPERLRYDIPTGPIEQRRAELMAESLRIHPNQVGVLEQAETARQGAPLLPRGVRLVMAHIMGEPKA